MEFEAVLMFLLLVLYLIAAGIKALFRLGTGAEQREQQEERRRQDEQRRQEDERVRQEQLRRKIKEVAKKQFEEAVMGGRFPSDEVLTILADCDYCIRPLNVKEAVEELLYEHCSMFDMEWSDAVRRIQQRQRTEERARQKAARGRQSPAKPNGAVTEDEARELLGVAPGCTPEELAHAYHKNVSQWHPDKLESMAQELKEYATRRTARINEAYQKLRSARV